MTPSPSAVDGYRSKRVLVTGAGGFIGSHLVEALVASGARTTALVRYNGRGDLGALAAVPDDVRHGVEVVTGDVRDPFQMRSLVDGQDVVLHLAALIGIPFSYQAPQSYLETNIQGTLNILEAVRSSGTPHVMVTSTSEVYGTARFTPITEEHPLQGQSPYSASKIGADALAESYHRAFGVSVTTVRPFNTYGPRQSTRAVLPTIVTQALGRGPVRLGSLSTVRDMTFVTDTVRGMLQCAVAPACVGKVTNLGTGRAWSVASMVELVGRTLGKALQVEEADERRRPDASEVLELLAHNGKAATRAGWSPTVPFEDGVEALVRDIRDNPGRYGTGRYHV